MIVKDYFKIGRGTSGVTEQLIYNNPGDVPVISATSDRFFIFGYGSEGYFRNNNCLIEIPVILVVRVGKAGKTQIVNFKKFAITENVLYIYPKKEFVKKFNLWWVENQLKNKLEKNARGDITGQRNISAEIINRIEIDKPDIDIQNNIAELSHKSEQIKSVLSDAIDKVCGIKESKIFEDLKTKLFEEGFIGDIFEIKGGNGGLTEEFIYNNQPNNEEEKIPVFSSATLDINLMGSISRNAMIKSKKIKIFYGPCLLVTRNGYYAGTIEYIDSPEFTANDHVYIFSLKNEWENKIDLKWFKYQYQELFYNLVTSKSDNATFNKEYAEKQKIRILYIEFQNTLSKKLHKLDYILEKLRIEYKKIEDLSTTQIS